MAVNLSDSLSSGSFSGSGGFVTVPQNREERRAFLQLRIALFGKMLAITSALFWMISASSHFLLAAQPSLLLRLSLDRYDLFAIGTFLLLWLVTRQGRLPLRALELLEAAVAILTCGFYAVMAAGSATEYSIFIPLVAALAILMARAIIIPTTARRTLVVSCLGMAPAVWAAFSLAYELDVRSSIPRGLGPLVYGACWAGTGVAIATLASRIIYRLEHKVRSARRLGQYTLAERIGDGGMGIVYRASHAMMRRPTAVKVLPPDKMGRQNVVRFEREVQLTSQLTHPNTICIYDFGRTPDGLFYYAMEYLDGYTLGDIVRVTGPMSAPRIAWLLRQVAGSLAEAHQIGLIHRDIKPENIVVCERGGRRDVVKVLDFGLVKDFNSSEPALSQVDAVIGTPLFMSPESLTNPAAVGAASDLYALGAVAYYLAAGKHVFEATTFAEISAHHIMTDPPPLPPDVPEALARVILDCLAKRPEDRPASAAALETTLAGMVDGWGPEPAEAWWRLHGAKLTAWRRARTPEALAPTLTLRPMI